MLSTFLVQEHAFLTGELRSHLPLPADSRTFTTLIMHHSQSTVVYAPVVDLEYDDVKTDGSPQPLFNHAQRSRTLRLSLVLSLAILCIVLGFGVGLLIKQKIDTSFLAPTACPDPVIRREWRGLSDAERQDYIEAVQCLRSSPSRLGLNQSLYDDFPYVHSRNGEACE